MDHQPVDRVKWRAEPVFLSSECDHHQHGELAQGDSIWDCAQVYSRLQPNFDSLKFNARIEQLNSPNHSILIVKIPVYSSELQFAFLATCSECCQLRRVLLSHLTKCNEKHWIATAFLPIGVYQLPFRWPCHPSSRPVHNPHGQNATRRRTTLETTTK